MSGSTTESNNSVIVLNDHLKIGGKETQIANLIFSFEQSERQIGLRLLDGPNEYSGRASFENIRIFNWNTGRFEALINLIFDLVNNKPEIIHFFSLRTGLAALIAMPMLGFRPKLINGYIRNTHGPRSRKQRLNHRILAFFSSSIISNSQAGLRAWDVNGLKKSHVIYNSFVPIAGNSRGFQNGGTKNVVMVGRYTPAKDFDLFFKAARIIRQTDFGVVFHSYGAGEEMERLKSTYHDDSLKVHGSSLHIDSIIRSSDLMVLCSKKEGIPNVLLESMYYRKPVIAVGRGGISELIVDGLNGVHMETCSPDRLAKVISQELLNRDELKTENAHRTVVNLFGIERMHSRYNDLYKNTINR